MESTNKFSVTIPLFDNEGESLRAEENQIAEAILSIAGGFSRTRIQGAWRDDAGKVYEDESRVYFTYVDDEKAQQLLSLTPAWAALLRQECLMVEVQAVKTAFVYPVSTQALA